MLAARIVCLLLLVPAGQAQLFVAVVPDLSGAAAGDEGFALGSTGAVDLTGWSVTDGEGVWALPAMTLVGEAWFAGDADAWAARDGPPLSGTFGASLRLGNGGDDLHLLAPAGDQVDAFYYGSAAPPGWELSHQSPDLVFRRLPAGTGWQDTDSAEDWRTPRLHRMGESRMEMPWFDVDRVTAYTSPDSSFAVLTGQIEAAQTRLHLHVYELRSRPLADALVAAAQRGVDVQVLVTHAPIGQEERERHETADALRRIEAAGGTASIAGNDRYRFHHLKVLVADDAVAVQSENWVPSGVPEDPSWGNRGWGVVLHDRDAAAWFAAWMAADRAAWDTTQFDLAAYAPGFAPPPRHAVPTGPYRPTVAIASFTNVRVQAVVTPDATHDPRTDPSLEAARGVRHRLLAQQLDFTTAWQNPLGWQAPDGLREALRSAGARGLDARVMVAAPFRADDTGNADAMAGLGIAGCTFAVPGLVLHNKGLIADDVVYVGSMNGNQHSRSMNREAGVLLHDPRVADHFAAAFEQDWHWCGAEAAPVPMLFAVAAVVAAHRCYRPSRSPPS